MVIGHTVISRVYGEIGWLLGILSLVECMVIHDSYYASCHWWSVW